MLVKRFLVLTSLRSELEIFFKPIIQLLVKQKKDVCITTYLIHLQKRVKIKAQVFISLYVLRVKRISQ